MCPAGSSVKVPEIDKHLKKAGVHIDRNVVEITIKMKTIVRKPLMRKICGLKGENIVNYCTVTKWFKNVRSGCKNLVTQTKSDGIKKMYSGGFFEDVDSHLVCYIRRVSGELDILEYNVIRHLREYQQ